MEPPKASAAPEAIGRYQVLEIIGRGAMGVVYKARDPDLDRVVAIKTIYAPAQLGERVRKAFLERFQREARAAARISHPAIVTIFDVGLTQENPFLVMEYLPGETLADRLDRERMPLGQAVECARELAAALGQAHKERIVHRDVKPANVLHAGETHWKLADFGIARLPDSDLTQIGTFMGTPGYAPPEAIRDGRYTVQADVFAWGAVFYELLCGRVPYEGPDTETTNKYVLRAEAASPRVHDPSVPEALAKVALKALAHDPAKRFADGNQAANALKEAWDRALASGAVPMSAFASSPRGEGGGASRQVESEPATVVDPEPSGARVAAKPAAAGLPPATRPAPQPPAAAAGKAGLPKARGIFQQAAADVPGAPANGSLFADPDAGAETNPVIRAGSSKPRDDVAKVIKTGPIDVSHIRTPVQQAAPAPQRDNRFWMYFAIMLVALAAGAVLAFLYLRRT